MNILITGGAGFIGTHLYNKLTKDGHFVYRIDNFKTSKKTKGVIPMDLGNLSLEETEFVEKILGECEVVYHFASSIGVELIESDPSGTLMNSFNINNNLFPLFEKYQNKVIYASSSEVYGSSEKPMNEGDDLVIGSPQSNMRWAYATQKLMSEFLIKSYTFPYTIVRFFNVTGKGQTGKYGMVMPRFMESAKNNTSIEVYGDGKQIRAFCDVRDAVNVLEMLQTEMNGEILNIGNEDNTTRMFDLAMYISLQLNSNSPIVKYKSEREDHEINTRIPDTSKMRTIYTPKYDLKDIIESMR